MDNNKKGIIAVAISLGVVGLAYYFLVARKKSSLNENLALVKEKFGDKGVIAANPNDKKENDLIVVIFNDNKNFAQYFGAGTFFIFDNTVKPAKQLVSGTYSKGGTNIKLANGKEIKNKDVFIVLEEAIK
jgi:hypothetical protein